MKPTVFVLLFSVLFFAAVQKQLAQSGMEFEDFRQKLQPYFDNELIDDLKASMPQGSSYRVWGWDVGDFSGDGVNDVAFSVNVLGTRRKENIVYLFVDVEGYLTNISRTTYSYIDLPLEIGTAIKDTTCYITQKRKADYWTIKGFQFRDGSIALVDEFVSNNIEGLAHELFVSYRTLESRERFLTSKGAEVFSTNYLSVPCYSRGRQIYAGYVGEATIDKIKNVVEGSYWWKGPEDASFTTRIVYDNDYLYVRVNVTDSNVVTGWCDTCVADRIDMWFDVTPPGDLGGSRYISDIKHEKITARTVSDSGLYSVSVRIGDFMDVRPSVKVKTTDELDEIQEQTVQQVRAVTARRKNGYVVKVRIPFKLLGYDKAPVDEKVITEMGCTVALYDVDNEFRAEETTLIATSPIQPLNPSSYGAVKFIPDMLWYGETTNIYVDAVLNSLRELGF